VAVDIRRSSPSFGEHVKVVLRVDEWNQVLIPPGFAHGSCTLEANTEVIYKVDDGWYPDCARGILWNDPHLGIEWSIPPPEAMLSEKDARFPRFREATDLFPFSVMG